MSEKDTEQEMSDSTGPRETGAQEREEVPEGDTRDDARDDGSAVSDSHVVDGRADSVPTTVGAVAADAGGVRRTVDTGVPPGVEVAAAWSWRVVVIVLAAAVLGFVLSYLSQVVIPVIVAILLTALLAAPTRALRKAGLGAGPSAGISVVGTIVLVAGLLTLVGATIQSSFTELSSQVTAGLQELRDMAKVNLNITDADLQNYLDNARQWVTSGSGIGARAAEFGTTASHVVAGLFITLFATFFFLYQGGQIWSWLVRLFPRVARERVDSSARQAWVTLTAYVRATILVAATDAIGITIGAVALQLPAWPAIGVLVFVGAFVPIVGALVSGFVAVIIAFVAKGWVAALIMLAVVVGVQQLESHVLQPFLLGRAVSVHPLAVILAIATGVVVAGIVGALVAVPLAATTNTIVKHLAGRDDAAPPEKATPRRA
ncbi:AI-2E family transporter [Knoellia koreensis]